MRLAKAAVVAAAFCMKPPEPRVRIEEDARSPKGYCLGFSGRGV